MIVDLLVSIWLIQAFLFVLWVQAPRAIEDFSVLLHDGFVYIFGGRYSYRSEESDSEREDMDQDTNETKSNELFRFSVSGIKIFGSKDSESASPTVSWENMHIESAENRPSPRSRSSACAYSIFQNEIFLKLCILITVPYLSLTSLCSQVSCRLTSCSSLAVCRLKESL